MKTHYLINKGKASKLYQTFENLNIPGSGIVRYSKNAKLDESMEIASLICDVDLLTGESKNDILSSGRTIALEIS